jgi:hypothetical protein
MRILLDLSDDLVAAIDAARNGSPRGPWLENRLRRLADVRAAAKRLGLALPPRADDARGKHSKRGPKK